MQNLRCPVCNKKSNQPINLRCQHHPCFECASQIITIDHQSTLQTKYKIICPVCHKKTITYDLRHLIISTTQQDQDLYVTTKYITKKPQIVPLKKSNNYTSSCSSRMGHSKTNSQGGMNISLSNRPLTIQCKKHQGHNLQYFCDDCSLKNQHEIFLCAECAKNHSKHKINNIRTSGQKIYLMNQRKKQQVFASRFQFLEDTIYSLSERKQKINNQFQNIYKQISDQFKLLYHYINEQYESVKKELKHIYNKQCQQIRNSLGLAQKIKESLQELEKIPTHNCAELQAHVHYSMCFFDIQRAIQSNKYKLCEKFEIPKIIKRKTITIGSNDRPVQIQSNICYKMRESSRPITPTNSARFLNSSLDSSKNPKNQQRGQKQVDINMLKENNFYPLSPKNYFSHKLNV